MWGTWLIGTAGATAGVALLIVGFAFGGWAALIALSIFAMIGAVLLAGASWRRSGQYVRREDEAPVSSPGSAGTGRPSPGPPASPRSGGAPASGEGG